MNRTFQAVVAALILAVGIAGSVAAGPLDDGMAAFNLGDYATAMRLWRPLADQGDALPQTFLGNMYKNGWGVPQEYATAVSWYRKAADQGFAYAQNSLTARASRICARQRLGRFSPRNLIMHDAGMKRCCSIF